MKPLPQIYCDLDQVLVNFLSGAKKAMREAGVDVAFDAKDQHIEKAEKWEILKKVPRFWANLEPMPDGMTLWKFIKSYDPYILSTPSRRMPSSIPEKKEWIRTHLGHVSKVLLVPRDQKQEYALTENGEPNVLIDDHIKNIQEWEAKGGIGVRHINSLNTISQLRKLGY